MTKLKGIFRRPGQFSITREFQAVCCDEALLEIQRAVYIVHAQQDMLTDELKFGGYSLEFRVVPEGKKTASRFNSGRI